MKDRKPKVEELLNDLRTLRRTTALGSTGSAKSPRITPSQWSVLMHIEQDGHSTVKDISQASKTTSSAATQLVDGLVRNGYIVRKTSSKDRRVVILTLSKKSKERIAQMKKQVLKKLLTLFEVLNDKEFGQYLALNKKLVRASLNKKISL
jgi:DNA-binding MarR family transcriptional regulator